MVHVTKPATTELRAMLKQCRAAPGHVMRLAWDGRTGIERTITQPQASDEVIQDDEGPVLAVEKALAQRLTGLVFDYVLSGGDVANGRMGFTLREPVGDECALDAADTTG